MEWSCDKSEKDILLWFPSRVTHALKMQSLLLLITWSTGSVNTVEKISCPCECSFLSCAKVLWNSRCSPKLCLRADKESAFNRCPVPGLSDLLNDETVFQCLAAFLAFIIMQTAADLGDVMSVDGEKNKMVHQFLKFIWLLHGFWHFRMTNTYWNVGMIQKNGCSFLL